MADESPVNAVLLQALGTTPQESALCFEDGGIIGKPKDLPNSPVPNFVCHVCKNKIEITTSLVRRLYMRKAETGRVKIHVPMSNLLSVFTTNFHQGRYSKLVKKS